MRVRRFHRLNYSGLCLIQQSILKLQGVVFQSLPWSRCCMGLFLMGKHVTVLQAQSWERGNLLSLWVSGLGQVSQLPPILSLSLKWGWWYCLLHRAFVRIKWCTLPISGMYFCLKKFTSFIHSFIHCCVCSAVCTTAQMWKAELAEVCSLLPTCGSPAIRSGSQAWHSVPSSGWATAPVVNRITW